MFGKMVLAIRLALGIFYLLSGLNWFFGFIPLLPHLGMPPDLPIKHALVVEMINSGWMYQSAKIVEVLFGLSLLANRALPLMLAIALPVAFITFMLDALILDDLARWVAGTEAWPELWAAIADMVIGGLCVLLAHLWLMGCYAAYYRPAFVWVAEPAACRTGGSAAAGGEIGCRLHGSGWLRRGFFGLGWLALALQLFNLYLFVGMIER